MAKRMRTLLRWLLLGLGVLSVGLGVVGIFVPVLPTTPFLLLAAFCFARSSDRFLRWLLDNRWFGSYVRNYREQRGMALRDKVLTILALWMGIGVSGFLAVPSLWGRGGLLLIAAAVTIHLTRIRTLRPAYDLPFQDSGQLAPPLPFDND